MPPTHQSQSSRTTNNASLHRWVPTNRLKRALIVLLAVVAFAVPVWLAPAAASKVWLKPRLTKTPLLSRSNAKRNLSSPVVAGTIYVDDNFANPTLGQDPDGVGPATNFGTDSFATIQAGINAASPGDTVIVNDGTYTQASTISLNKSIILQGPNSAISPNGGTRVAEAVITGTASSILRISSPGSPVTIQGFKFDSTNVVDAYDPALDITIRKNIFSNGTSNGALYFLNAPVQLTIDDNYLTNAVTEDNDAIFVAGDWNGTTGTFATITNNVIENTPTDSSSGMNLSNVSGIITGNQFSKLRYYAILLANNSSSMTISGNTFDGMVNPDPVGVPTWGSGVRTYTPAFTGLVSITGNTFKNSHAGVGIRGVPNDAGADISGMNIHVNFNRFINNNFGISDGAAGTLDAQNNWWGCNYGPGTGGAGCSSAPNGIGLNGTAAVDADPWIVLGTSASPNPTTPGGDSTVTADMTHNSDAATPAGGPVPLIPVSFSATNGAMAPPAGTITAGQAISTFTSAGNSASTGCSTVDNQGVCTNITITLPAFSIDDVTQLEGSPSGTTAFVFTVNKTGSTALSTSVNFATVNGTATLADNDYQANSGTLNFTSVQTSQQITVLVNKDTTVEPNDAFTVHLDTPVGATISDADGTGTITNDDCVAFSTVYVDDSWVGTPVGTDPDGVGGPATAFGCGSFATIQEGINAVTSGGTVHVNSGTYNEDVDINKTITLHSTSGAATTTIVGAGHCLPTSCPGGPVSALTLSAPGVTIDGFTITASNPTISLITSDGSGNSINHVIKNNVITSPAFDDGNAGGGWGILLGYGNADNNQILNNEIGLNPDREKNQFTFGIWAQGGGSDNNVISGNTIHNIGTAIITDELDDNTDILNNTFSNLARRGVVVFGSTNTEITGNSISNAGTAGIQVRLGATNTIIKSNTITQSGVAPITGQTAQGGVYVSDSDGGTVTGVSVNFNRLFGNVPALNNLAAASVNAENNWWGCNAGPGTAGCDSLTGTADSNPWIVLGTSASPNPIGPGGMTTVTADMTHNSDSVVASAVDFVPPMDVSFTATQGTVLPTSGTITSGQATTQFTSNSTSSGTGCSAVDNSGAICTNIVVTLPSFSINDVSHNEGNGPGTTSYTFTVTKTGTTAFNSSVSFQTQDGTATLANNDYQTNSGTLNFAAADTTMPITVLVNGDTSFEADEAFNVQLSAPSGATIADADGAGTITNDDACAAFSTVYVDDSWVGTPVGTDPDGVGPATVFGCDSFATIQGGVTAVTSGGTVIVRDGTYTENVTISKPLTLKGNQFGVDARGRVVAESTVSPATAGSATFLLDTTTTATVIDGFNFTGGTSLGVIQTQSGGDFSNLQIKNNRFSNYSQSAVFLNRGGNDITIDKNVMDGSNISGSGQAIFGNGPQNFNGLFITNNDIINNTGRYGFFVDGNHNVGESATRAALISGNLFNNNLQGLNLGSRSFGKQTAPVLGTYAGTISNNTFSNNTANGIQAGIQHVLVSGNTFTNNAVDGLALTSFGNTGADRGAQNSDIFSNTFSGQGRAGIFFSGTQGVGLIETNKANFNSIRGNAVGIQYGSTVAAGNNATINVENNWWGCNFGPGATGPGCSGATNGTLVFAGNTGVLDSNPWIVLGASASPSSIPPAGSSTVTADMTRNSDNVAPSATDFVPPVEVTFSATNGTIGPSPGTITSGQAVSTFTSNVNTNGQACAMVNNQQTCTTITVAFPSFSIGDVTLAEGNAGTTSFTFTITKTGAGAASVDYATIDGTAKAPADYAAISQTTLSFLSGDASKTVTVQVNGDTTLETNETFTVQLSNAVNATISDADALGTITNDDSCAAPSTVYVDKLWTGTAIGDDPDGAGPATSFGCDSFATIQEGINGVAVGGNVIINAGTYNEDVNLNKAGVSLLGAGSSSVTVSGPIGGPGSTIVIAASNVTVAGMTITRAGNNTTDWNNGGLNTAGISIQGQAISNALIRDNVITGNRTGIDINNSNGHTIRNNVIDFNRTGMIMRNQTDSLIVVENFITNNWTVGVLFLDGSGAGTPPQTALYGTFSNNNISGNWYGQIVDRQTGGSIPPPGSNPKNFKGNWFGTTSPVVTTADSTEPAYAGQIPVAYGGSAAPPGGKPDIEGPASANFQYLPLLQSGTDTNVETTPGRGTNGFQGGQTAAIVVRSSSLKNWAQQHTTCGAAGTGSQAFVIGPPTAPIGEGSLQYLIGANGDSVESMRSPDYNGIRLDSLTQLGYSTYAATGGGQAPYMRLDVDNDNNGSLDDSLFFEPVYQNGGYATIFPETIPNQCGANPNCVTTGQWQTWNTLTGGWWSNVESAGGPPLISLARYAVEHPGARIINAGGFGGLRISTGCGAGAWDNFDGNTDDVNIGVSGVNTRYDFEPLPRLSIDDVAHSEGQTGTTTYTFTVSLSRDSDQTVTVSYETANDSATAPADYTAVPPTVLTFNPGETSKTITVDVSGDMVYEGTEQFFVNLSSPNAHAVIADGQGVGTITEDDTLPSFSIDDVTHMEGNPPGTTSYVFTVTKAGATAFSSSVQFQTVDGSATVADNDYASNTGTLNFGPADTTMQVTVQVNHDFKEETDEAFTVNLFGVIGATISDADGTGTIQNDDTTPTIVFVDDDFTGPIGSDPDGAGLATAIGYDAFATIQEGINGVASGGTVNVYAGTYSEDVTISQPLSLLGIDSGTKTVIGPIGGSGSTIAIAASNVTVAGLTITRAGNNTTDWNNPGLNTAGISIQGQAISNALIRDNVITQLRTGIDINNSNGHTVRNNVITDNRTGLIFRNQTDNLTVVENFITNNWTVGIVFLDGSGGSNVPVQTARHSTFSNNDLSGNWYGQIVDRQSGGSLPAPGTNLKNFRGNWLGTASPVVTTANSTEPGYAAQIPVAFGGTATPPGGQPDIAGPASANFKIDPVLTVGTDTNIETTPGRGTNGFQGVANSVVVEPSSLHGWAFFDDFPGTGTGSGGFADGPGTAPLGAGSAFLTVDANGRHALGTTAYIGTRMDDITELKYWSYQNNNTNTAAAIALQFDIDYDLNDADNAYMGRLVFEPYISYTVQQGVWQNWDALAGKWYGTRMTVTVNGVAGVAQPCQPATPCTWAQVLASFPNAGVGNTPARALLFKAGGPVGVGGFSGNVDDFSLKVNSAAQTYDFEPNPHVSINDVSHNEGNAGTTSYDFTVTLSRPSSSTVTVDYVTANDTAVAPGDFTALSTTQLVFNPGETSKPVTVLVNGDVTYEPGEQFFVNLSNPSANADITDNQGVGTIVNDDASPSFSIDDVTHIEGDPPGTTSYVFTVTKAGATDLASSVQFQTVNGSATVADNDYTANTGTLNFGPSDTTMQVTVQVTHDFKEESDEAFTVNLFGVVGATISDADGTGTIQNDDTQPSIVFVDDDFTGPIGSDPDGAGLATAIGYDAFATIQEGINAVASGGTVIVYAGNYKENPNANKAVTLAGPNAGVAGSAVRVDEANVITNGNQTAVFTVTSNNVTIDGFTVDGDDPLVTGGLLKSGEDANVSYGVRPTGAFNHLTVQNNIIKRAAIGFRGDGASKDNLITANWFDSIGNFDFGYCVSLRTDFYADITNNKMTRAWTGVHINDHHTAGGPASFNISNNEIHSYAGGILYWLNYNAAIGATINANTITAESGAVANNFGVLVVTLQDAVSTTITSNTISGHNYGVGLFNVPTTSTITLGSTNSISGSSLAGILLTDNLNFNPVGTTNFLAGGPGAASTVNVSGLSISGNTGDGVKVEGATNAQTLNVNVSTITGTSGTKGVELVSPQSFINLTASTVTGFSTGVALGNSSGATAHVNRIISGTTAIDNPNNQTANLENNWWGCNAGPGNTGCGAVNGTGADFNPWIVLGVSASPASISAGGTSTVTADMTQNSDGNVPVGVTTLPLPNASFTATNGTILPASNSFTAGQSQSTFTSNSSSDGQGCAAVDNSTAICASITVTTPAFSINDVTHMEGNPPGTTAYVFTVTKTGTTALSSSVQFQTVDGTATVADNDYTSNTGTLNFGPSDTTLQITVQVNHDFNPESDEAFTVNLFGAVGATISDADGTGTIQNDDSQPNVVWVDDDFTGPLGSDPDGAGPATAIGYDAFVTIQGGVNGVAANGTVHIAAGNYPENVTVPKSLSLLGPNASVNPNTGTRVAEAVVRPAVTETSVQASTSGTIFRLGSGSGHIDVTVKGLTIDGNNSALTGGRTLNGVQVHTGAGITNSVGSFDTNPGAYDVKMIVQNNIIQNLERYGVLADGVPSTTPSAGTDVSFNKIDNLPSGNNFGGDRGRGVAFEENVYGSCTFNVMTRVNVGWQDDNYYLASPGAGTVVDNNEIHTYHRGIFHNLQYQNATPATISNNKIFAETTGDFPASTTNFGVELASIQSAVGVTVTSNDSTGNVYGILLWNLPTTSTITVSGGTLTGNQYGVLATLTDPQFGAGAAGHVVISGVTVSGATVAGMAADGAGASMEVTGSTITSSAKGVVIRNGAVGNAITGNSIHDNTGLGIDLGDDGVTANDPNDVDSGPNNLQNFPIIGTALVGSPNTISGTLNSAPSQAFTIHLYANPTCDSSGNGEGQTSIGSTTANTDGSGNAVWTLNPVSLTVGNFITATATDSAGNTSEFSACFQARAFTPGTLTFNQVSNSETNGDHNVDVIVSRTVGSDGAVSVQYNVTDGTATLADNDYSVAAPSGTLTWANGDASDRLITISVKGDSKFEADETVLLTLSNPTGGASTGGTNPALTITNDDTTPSFSIDDVTHNEGNGGTTAYVFTITKTGTTALNAGVNFQTADNSATLAGSDYQSQTGSLTFLPADTTKTVTVLVNGDTNVEPDEAFSLNLSGATNASITDSQGVGTITNDDTDVTLSVSPASVSEDGAGNLVYTFTRSGIVSNSLTVNFSVSGGAAFSTDYTQLGATTFTSSSGTVTFGAGNATAQVTVDPITDTTVESDETVVLTLTGGTGYSIGTPGAVTGTVTNDDTDVSVAVSPATALEDGATNLVYTFTRNGDTTGTLTVNFSVAGGATFGTDYTQTGAATFTATTGSVTFAAGNSTATVTIDPSTDVTVEPDETVVLTLTGGTGYNVATPSVATSTITNDDTDVSVAVSPATVPEDGATNLVYTFTRNGNTTGALTANFSVAGGATFGTDYTQTGAATFTATTGSVTFAAGNSTATVTIDPSTDATVEPDETVVLTLTSGTGYNVASPSVATSTITNDDTDVSVAVAPATVLEDGATNLVYTFTRNGNTTGTLTANFSVAGGATFNTDYTQTGAATFTATTGSVTFAAGNSTATVTVDPSTDTTVESDETVILTVTSGTGYNVATPAAATGTITNDDADVTLSVSPASVNEDGATNLVYTFTRNGNTTGALTANFSVAGSATFNTDYTQTGAATFTATTGSVTFAAASSTATVTIDPSADTTVESDETVILTVTSGTGYNVATPSAATGTITNDEGDVSVAVSPSTVPEDGAANLVYTFTRNGNTTGTLTATFSVTGSAAFGTDYTQSGAAVFTAISGSVTFAAGSSTATVTIDPSTDVIVEPDETVILTVTSGTGYSVGSPSGATGTIVNDDGTTGGSLQFSAASYNVGEGSFFTTITVRRLGDTTGAVSVDYATPDDSAATTVIPCETASGIASPRCDFTTAVGTLHWASGDNAPKTFIVLISEDDYVEGPESLTLTLSNPTGGAHLGSPATASLTINDDATEPNENPIDGPPDFVRQHYHDFLNREPDPSGFDFWVGNFPPCNGDPQCIEVKRINVSASFYLSIEFQGTGYFVERLYKSSYGDATGTSTIGTPHTLAVPIVKFSEFLPDTQEIGRGVVVLAPGWEAALEANKVAFTEQFVQRARFLNAYPLSMTPAQFVDALNANAGNPLSTAERNQLVSDLTGGAKTRAQVLRAITDDQDLINAEFNRGFVLMQYFGFLRRNPNAAPDLDHSGYDFWLQKLNQFNGNFVEAEMVKAFLTSIEYRARSGRN